jgi:hypothetical protein
MSTRICPRCRSLSVHRSGRRGLLEGVLLPLFVLRPYRCMNCWRRYYGFIFAKHHRARVQPSVVSIPVLVPVLRGAFGLLVFFAIPLLLPGAAPVLRTLSELAKADWNTSSPSQPVTRARIAGQPPRSPHLISSSPAAKGDDKPGRSKLSASVGLIEPASYLPAPQREALGSLRSTGEVYVTDSKAPAEVVVFSGDTVRTGADGSAELQVAGKGVILIYQHTEISFAGRGYFATLKQGSVSFRTVADVRDFEIRMGSIVVVPEGTVAATADIERDADGSARVRCTLGSMGVVSLEGPYSTFLRPGQEAFISPDGKITLPSAKQGEGENYESEVKGPAKAGTAPGSAPPAVKSPGGGTPRTTWIVLGVGGGAAAGVAAALAGHSSGSSSSVSPFTP